MEVNTVISDTPPSGALTASSGDRRVPVAGELGSTVVRVDGTPLIMPSFLGDINAGCDSDIARLEEIINNVDTLTHVKITAVQSKNKIRDTKLKIYEIITSARQSGDLRENFIKSILVTIKDVVNKYNFSPDAIRDIVDATKTFLNEEKNR